MVTQRKDLRPGTAGKPRGSIGNRATGGKPILVQADRVFGARLFFPFTFFVCGERI